MSNAKLKQELVFNKEKILILYKRCKIWVSFYINKRVIA